MSLNICKCYTLFKIFLELFPQLLKWLNIQGNSSFFIQLLIGKRKNLTNNKSVPRTFQNVSLEIQYQPLPPPRLFSQRVASRIVCLPEQQTNREAIGTFCWQQFHSNYVFQRRSEASKDERRVWVVRRAGGKKRGWKAWDCAIMAWEKKTAAKKCKECNIERYCSHFSVTPQQYFSSQVCLLCLHSWSIQYFDAFNGRKQGNVK